MRVCCVIFEKKQNVSGTNFLIMSVYCIVNESNVINLKTNSVH